MQALVVVELEIGGDTAPRLSDVLISVEINLLVLEAAPQPFHEDVVGKPAAAVHADRNPVGAQQRSEAIVGELAALIGIEDLGTALQQRLLQRLDTEAGP